jgi:hypothetical protein
MGDLLNAMGRSDEAETYIEKAQRLQDSQQEKR